MPPAGFEPAIPASDRPQTHALDCSSTGTGSISPTECAKSAPRGTDMRLEFCHWLHANRQLLSLVLFTDEATSTRNEIKNTRISHRWAHENPHGTVETYFQSVVRYVR